jgi:hypothetical protein
MIPEVENVSGKKVPVKGGGVAGAKLWQTGMPSVEGFPDESTAL